LLATTPLANRYCVDANGFDGIRLWIFGHEGEGTAPVSAGVMLAA
jgi:hypothetical protein